MTVKFYKTKQDRTLGPESELVGSDRPAAAASEALCRRAAADGIIARYTVCYASAESTSCLLVL